MTYIDIINMREAEINSVIKRYKSILDSLRKSCKHEHTKPSRFIRWAHCQICGAEIVIDSKGNKHLPYRAPDYDDDIAF